MTEETIFQEALERQSHADRAAYLDTACAGNPALRERVEALLRSHADPDSFLDVPALLRQADEQDQPDRATHLPAATGAADKAPAAADDFRSLLSPPAEAGSLGRLDHYEVLEVVGRGGMGVVFKARDTRLQRIVAVKVLAAHLAASGTARQRFFREARSAAAVRDDHVVSIHAVSDDGGSVPYLVMEFIAGVTLEKRLQTRGPLAVKEVLRIGMQAAAGLAAAHRQGLVHRDVKPGNVLLENGVERVKITDFGLARAADDVNLSQPGTISGTASYMSPEQARGQSLDARSDLFSLGGVLYALCTGSPPFRADSTPAVLKRVCEEAPRPIREVNPDVPVWLAAVVDKLLAKEPAERFQSAAELAELLGQLLAQLQASSLPPSPAEVSAGAPPAAPQPEAKRRPAARRRRWWVAAGAVMVGVLVCLVSVAILSRMWSPPSPGKPAGPDDPPGVLTVSKKREDGGRFRTIQAALDEVEPGKTIRVLDDAVYEEHLQIDNPKRHRGVVLEAPRKATLCRPTNKPQSVLIEGVPGFILRDFHFKKVPDQVTYWEQILITGRCPGVVLDRLNITTGNRKAVVVYDTPLLGKDDPIVIQNCTVQGAPGDFGIVVEGSVRGNVDRPLPCGHVVIRNNTAVGCGHGVLLFGAVRKAHVVGNSLDSNHGGIDLLDLREGAADILIANNTLLGSDAAVRLSDDHLKGKDFLKCKNVRVQNNLVFKTDFSADMVFSNFDRHTFQIRRECDLKALLDSPEWHFGYNWRENDKQRGARVPDRWIPPSPTDHLQVPIKVLSRNLGDPNFLRPPKGSPLGRGGAGVSDPALPAYVGAVPPEDVQPWDWDKTWKMLAR